MATMMLMIINFINAQRPLLKFIIIHIIAAISWLPLLISQLLSPRIFEDCTLFILLSCFSVVSYSYLN